MITGVHAVIFTTDAEQIVRFSETCSSCRSPTPAMGG